MLSYDDQVVSAATEPDQTAVVVRVPAKVNLQLTVGPDRGDGYHSLVTVFHAVSLFDEVTVRPEKEGYAVTLGGETELADTMWQPGDKLLRFRLDGHIATVQIDRLRGRALRLSHAGVTRRAQVLSPRAAELLRMMPPKEAAETSRQVLSPMPGLLSALVVEEGQEVKAGEALAVVEAMKMENVLRAERNGTIAKLCAKPGDSLAVDQVILEFA